MLPKTASSKSLKVIFFGRLLEPTSANARTSVCAIEAAAKPARSSISADFPSAEPDRPPEPEIAICLAEIFNRLATAGPPPSAAPPDMPEIVAFVVPSVVIVTLPSVP